MHSRNGRWGFLYLYIPILVVVFLDIALTIHGGWQFFLGKEKVLAERAPLGAYVFALRPFWKIGICICIYSIGIFLLLWKLSHRLRLVIFSVLIFGHGCGSVSWLTKLLKNPNTFTWFLVDGGFFVSVGLLYAWAIDRYYRYIRGRSS